MPEIITSSEPLSRRDLIKKSVAAGALVWTAPQVTWIPRAAPEPTCTGGYTESNKSASFDCPPGSTTHACCREAWLKVLNEIPAEKYKCTAGSIPCKMPKTCKPFFWPPIDSVECTRNGSVVTWSGTILILCTCLD